MAMNAVNVLCAQLKRYLFAIANLSLYIALAHTYGEFSSTSAFGSVHRKVWVWFPVHLPL